MNCRATAGVTPAVPGPGCRGAANWACMPADCPGGKAWNAAAIGVDPSIAAAGTIVAAPRLMKLFTAGRLLAIVTVEIV